MMVFRSNGEYEGEQYQRADSGSYNCDNNYNNYGYPNQLSDQNNYSNQGNFDYSNNFREEDNFNDSNSYDDQINDDYGNYMDDYNNYADDNVDDVSDIYNMQQTYGQGQSSASIMSRISDFFINIYNKISDNIRNLTSDIRKTPLHNDLPLQKESIDDNRTHESGLLDKFNRYFSFQNTKLILTVLIVTVVCSLIWGISTYLHKSSTSTTDSSNIASIKDNNVSGNGSDNLVPAAKSTAPSITLEPTNDIIDENDVPATDNATDEPKKTETPSTPTKDNQAQDSDSSEATKAPEKTSEPVPEVTKTEKPIETEEPAPEIGAAPESFISFDITESNTWNTGNVYFYIYNIAVNNKTSDAINNWTLSVTLPDGSKLADIWGASSSNKSGTLNVTPADWNKSINSGSAISFQICIYSGSKVSIDDLSVSLN